MTKNTKVLAIAGSARPGSLNKSLLKIAAQGATDAGAEVTLTTIADFDLPLFNADALQADGFPPGAVRLKEAMKGHDGLLIASPEYNSSVSAPLKNAIDWASRTMDGEDWKECFVGKTAAIMCASTGGIGGLKGLLHLREILSACQVHVIPPQMTLGGANKAFGDDGNLADPDAQKRAMSLGAELARVTARLAG